MGKNNYPLSKEVRELRKKWGLKKVETGEMKCLTCGLEFKSYDKSKNRLCKRCAENCNTLPDIWEIN